MQVNDRKRIAETILDYWYTMEFLGQDTLPQLSAEEMRKNNEAAKKTRERTFERNTNNKQGQVKTREANVLQILVQLKKEDNISDIILKEVQKYGMKCWGNISFYVGRMRREYCIQKLAALLSENDVRPEETEDLIAWFSLQTDAQGIYKNDTISLSTLIWAINHAAKTKKKSLTECLNEKIYREDVEVTESWIKDIVKAKKIRGEEEFLQCSDIYSIYQRIGKQYIQGMLPEQEFFCLMQFQVFKDEKAQEKYTDDNYLGLGMDFYSADLKMVLNELKSGRFGAATSIQKSVVDYIVGPYSESYPDENILSNRSRSDVGDTKKGQHRRNEMRNIFSNILNVQKAPAGKWPSRFMPALMQQVAINLSISGKENTAIFSVNGPPGTGKTTLLKEIVVNNIVKRAELLSEYLNPDDAFEACKFGYGEKINNGYSKYCSKYYKLKDDAINNYGILVASNNNAAVQNITKELPLQDRITGTLEVLDSDSEQMKKQLQEVQDLFSVEKSKQMEELYYRDEKGQGEYKDIYFSEYATELLDGEKAWGLISAALGKKSNIHKFYQSVLRPLDNDFYKSRIIEGRSYTEARKQFIIQRKKVDKLMKDIAYYCEMERDTREGCKRLNERIIELTGMEEMISRKMQESGEKLKNHDEEIDVISQKYRQQEARLFILSNNLKKADEAVGKADKGYEECLKKAIDIRDSIGLLGKLFKKSETKTKIELAQKYETEAAECRLRIDELKNVKERCEKEYNKCEKDLHYIEQDKSHLEAECCKLREKIDQYQRDIVRHRAEKKQCTIDIKMKTVKYSALVNRMEKGIDVERLTPLSDAFMEMFLSDYKKESTISQISSLWFTNYYNREREKLFYYALKLNKEFVLSSKCCFRNYRNLAFLWQERNEEETNQKVEFHPKDREDCFGPLLQSLFLLVPVISTTFASVGKFLNDIKKPNIIGTLIIDEAGQAPPQMAVGALYRSRRAIIVGDPRQVEPVVTEDLVLLKRAFKEDVYKPYKSKKISVQQLADIINPYGTYLENEFNENEWVGCPLVVHRRCISPMYEISNQISYNNTMKQKTRMPSIKKEALFCYKGSRWINVSGKEKGHGNHYVEEQGKRALEILEVAFSKQDIPSLYIITPFTTVKRGMINCINQVLQRDKASVLYKKKEFVKEWMYECIGTVHAFQGKEADEVIFLLGCDSSKEAAGAIRWVSSNIVNVAVTRAKFRLYVIGDEKAWRLSEYIRQAKKIIDTYALEELSTVINDLEEEYEERQKRALEFYDKIPSAESFAVDISENNYGELEYSPSTELFLDELKSSNILLREVTDEQLKGYGFSREVFLALDVHVRTNIEWGIKLFSMFKKLRNNYDITEIDASCCAILFCKAIELQVKLCFCEGLKKQFPYFKISRKTNLKDMAMDTMTLGTFWFILHKEENKKFLSQYMEQIGKNKYDVSWWNKYISNLENCKDLRNNCCHHDKFTWDSMNKLLINLFLKDKSTEHPIMDGTVRDSEVGKYLV